MQRTNSRDWVTSGNISRVAHNKEKQHFNGIHSIHCCFLHPTKEMSAPQHQHTGLQLKPTCLQKDLEDQWQINSSSIGACTCTYGPIFTPVVSALTYCLFRFALWHFATKRQHKNTRYAKSARQQNFQMHAVFEHGSIIQPQTLNKDQIGAIIWTGVQKWSKTPYLAFSNFLQGMWHESLWKALQVWYVFCRTGAFFVDYTWLFRLPKMLLMSIPLFCCSGRNSMFCLSARCNWTPRDACRNTSRPKHATMNYEMFQLCISLPGNEHLFKTCKFCTFVHNILGNIWMSIHRFVTVGANTRLTNTWVLVCAFEVPYAVKISNEAFTTSPLIPAQLFKQSAAKLKTSPPQSLARDWIGWRIQLWAVDVFTQLPHPASYYFQTCSVSCPPSWHEKHHAWPPSFNALFLFWE